MKKRRIGIAVLVCTLLAGLIIFHFPRHRQISMPVCNAAGETVQLEIDVNYYRRLFSRPWVEGSVSFDGVVYYDSRTLWGPANQGAERSYWDWDWYFGETDAIQPANLRFYKPDNDRIKAAGNCITFYEIGVKNSFDYVIFTKTTDTANGFVFYYGPATTADEARRVADEFGWNFD